MNISFVISKQHLARHILFILDYATHRTVFYNYPYIKLLQFLFYNNDDISPDNSNGSNRLN
jgi:hypothetical protein